MEALELSQQECQIVRLILLGRSSAEMMSALHIRLGTLRTHKRHVFAKLGIHKQSQVAIVVHARVGAKAKEHIEMTSANELSIKPSTLSVALSGRRES
ncbi:MAG: hypothetical protein IID41_08715 [Planctomycetes bacterium]|nr:hypothetical protein [Planctomycetota bacterium]